MKYPKDLESDPFDGFISRTLKNWTAVIGQPSEKERENLLQTAGSIDKDSPSFWSAGFLLLTILRWLAEYFLFGSVDRPLMYSRYGQFASANSSDFTILMAKRGMLQPFPIQMGLTYLIS